jgi:hypothetical protein
MESDAHLAKQFWEQRSPSNPLPLNRLPLILDGISDPEEDAISDTQSFNEDDMYYSEGSDDEENATDSIPESVDDSRAPSDDAVLAHLESVDDVQVSLIGKVGHQNV